MVLTGSAQQMPLFPAPFYVSPADCDVSRAGSTTGPRLLRLNEFPVSAEMLQTDIYVTPAGTTEGDSYSVDAYLNFNLTLKAPPKGNIMTVSVSRL